MTAVILAAGSGTRLQEDLPKAYVLLAGKPVLRYSLESFQKSGQVDAIVIVVSPDMLDYAQNISQTYFRDITKFRGFITGGATRQHSVFNALKHLASNSNPGLVAIHDAARPFLKTALIEKLYRNAGKYGAAAPGIKVTDTIKEINADSTIKNHLKRENLIAIQTPQVFTFAPLLEVFNTLQDRLEKYTDDTELFSAAGKETKIIGGDDALFKITYKNDLEKARLLLEKETKWWI